MWRVLTHTHAPHNNAKYTAQLKESSSPPGAKTADAARDGNTDKDDDATDLLSDHDDDAALDDAALDSDAPAPVTKIIFCSRTHSQLSQFMRELRDRSDTHV
jgi:hypothetical protein